MLGLKHLRFGFPPNGRSRERHHDKLAALGQNARESAVMLRRPGDGFQPHRFCCVCVQEEPFLEYGDM